MPHQIEDEKPDELKSAIVTLLKGNQQIGMNCDLACYPDGTGFFWVEYILCKETVGLLNLTDQQKRMVMDEEELIEIFDNPEEAADLYIQLSGGKEICADNAHKRGHKCEKKRTLKEKAVAYDKDKYF